MKCNSLNKKGCYLSKRLVNFMRRERIHRERSEVGLKDIGYIIGILR